jgi:hypothetical protein
VIDPAELARRRSAAAQRGRKPRRAFGRTTAKPRDRAAEMPRLADLAARHPAAMTPDVALPGPLLRQAAVEGA